MKTEILKNEPVMVAYLAPVVTVILGLLVAFGVDLTEEQQQAIMTAVPVMALVVGGIANWLARNRVWTQASVDKAVAEASNSQFAPGARR